MLSFIFGTDEGQKLNEIYKLAATDAKTGKSVFILVPEQYSMYAEAQLISEMGLSAQSKIQILTFSRLCNLVFSKMGPLRTKYMDKAGKFIMTRKALNICSDNLEFFKRSIHRHGFAGLIQRTVSEFKRYGVSPQTLAEFSEQTQDERFSAKLRDLSLIYQQFNTLVDQNHSNAEDNLSLIIPKLSKADFLNGSFYITFFKSFTPTEYAVICELMLKSDVCVALSAENLTKKSSVFEAQKKTYRKLVEWAEKHSILTTAPVFLDDAWNSEAAPDLFHLKENFFQPSPTAYDKEPKSIRISRPRNFRQEVNDCARLIKQLVREKGYTYNDILILTGNMENYEFLIPQIFDEHGITYFLDRKTPLTSSPFMRMIIAILEVLAYGFSYDRIMLIARSGFLDISADDIDKFENYILAADIPHGLWTSREDWTYNPDKFQFDMTQINSVKSALIHPLLDLSDMFSGRKTAAGIHDNFCSWLTNNQIPQTVSKKIDDFKTASKPEQAENLRLVWNSFVSVLGQMRDYMEKENTTFAEFYEIFTSSCSELSVGMIPPTQDKVIISSIDLFRSIGTKAVIVLGALDGVFPRDYATEGLLTDAERNTMKEFGLNLAPDTFTQQQEEQFLIYSVLSTAREYLHIYAPLSDRDGKGLRPSEIIRTLTEDIFPKLKIEESSEDTVQSIESRKAAFNKLAVKLFENNMEVSGLSPLWKTVFNLLENDTDFAPKLRQLKKMSCATSNNTPLNLKTARKLYGSDLVFSVSKLEKYNACAFSFFMRYGLLAEERLLGGLNPSDTGNILHSVLCDYFKRKSEENADYSDISRENCYAEISSLVDKAGADTNENLHSSSNYYKYMMLRMKNIATATAWKLIKFYSQGAFRPTGFEISFGEKGTYPPYTLDSRHGEVSLKGFIDRVDSATINGKNHIAVSDYKSSERHLDMDLAEAGIHFQPFVYANALTSHMPDTEVSAMFYLHMNDPILTYDTEPSPDILEKDTSDNIKAHGKIVNDPDVLRSIDNLYDDKKATHYIKCDKASLMEKELFEKSLKDADKKAAETADNILDGKIDVNPVKLKGFDPCQYCPYGTVCRNNY